MHQRIFLYSTLLLLCFVFSITHADYYPDGGDDDEESYHPDSSSNDPATTAATGTTASSNATTVASNATTTKKYQSYGSRYGYSNKNRGTNGGYYDDNYELVGNDGKDPDKDGTDVGDFGPVYGRKPLLNLLDVWILADKDWETEGTNTYQNKPQGSYKNKPQNSYNKKPSKSKNYNDKNYKNKDNKGSRSKRSYKKVSFPVKRFKNYRKFPKERFPPLISIFPWVPIFYDRLTYQTIIFSPTGGIYIIPPLINFYGERFAVAQLIKWGYASLVSSGAPVGPGVDVAPLVQPAPAGGVAAGGVAFDSSKSQFVGGVKTDFRKFKPRYPQTVEEGGAYGSYDAPERPGPGSSRPNYGSNLDYGGSRDQSVYPQGGPPPKYGGY